MDLARGRCRVKNNDMVSFAMHERKLTHSNAHGGVVHSAQSLRGLECWRAEGFREGEWYI